MNPYNDSELKQYVFKYFHYKDGVITRTDRDGGCGSYDKDGYLIIKIKGRQIKAHRLAWLLCYGEFSKSEIDHINRIRTDNRIENLRESNREQQLQNTIHKKNPLTGVVGVHVDKRPDLRKKYATRYKKKIYRFYTISEAVKFRKGVGLWT